MLVAEGLEGQNKPWGMSLSALSTRLCVEQVPELQLGQHLSVLLNKQAPAPGHKLGNMETQEHRGCLGTALLQQTLGNKDIGVRKE